MVNRKVWKIPKGILGVVTGTNKGITITKQGVMYLDKNKQVKTVKNS